MHKKSRIVMATWVNMSGFAAWMNTPSIIYLPATQSILHVMPISKMNIAKELKTLIKVHNALQYVQQEKKRKRRAQPQNILEAVGITGNSAFYHVSLTVGNLKAVLIVLLLFYGKHH